MLQKVLGMVRMHSSAGCCHVSGQWLAPLPPRPCWARVTRSVQSSLRVAGRVF